MKRIEIFDRNSEGALSFDLRDVVAVLSVRCERLHWYVIEWEGVNRPEGIVAPLLRTELRRPGVVGITWADLSIAAAEIEYTEDAMLIGFAGPREVPTPPIDARKESQFVLIEAIDSSLWAITSDLTGIVDDVRERFADTRLNSLG